MKIISHRGNLYGPSNKENTPEQILEVISKGFECEIDLWYTNQKLMLGHDKPQYEIDLSFLNDTPNLWVHAKNIEALNYLNDTGINYFFHNNDDATLTSRGYIWCYPGVYCKNGITVLADKISVFSQEVAGVCTDYPFDFLEMLPTGRVAYR